MNKMCDTETTGAGRAWIKIYVQKWNSKDKVMFVDNDEPNAY